MTSTLVERRAAPRVLLKPEATGTSGPEAVELARACGLELDDWQVATLDVAMAERGLGWAAVDVALIASRQNGKNCILEARELFGLAVLGEQIIHTSHQFKTTRESFTRLLSLVEANQDVADCLTKKLGSPMSGYEMHFRSGGRIVFIARSRSSGRGLTGDLLVCDEAQDLSDDALGALLPTISARPGAQTWYLGSAPGLGSTVFHRIRRRGRSGEQSRLAYFEFSADPDCDPDDRVAWRQANPADRVTDETIERERRSMSTEMFLRERLSVSPDLAEGDSVIPIDAWDDCNSADLEVIANFFALDCNPERTAAGIVTVGDGPALEVVDYRPSVAWCVDRAENLHLKYKVPIVIDAKGPAGTFIADLKQRKVPVVELGVDDMTRAAARFYDRVIERAVRIRRNPDLDAAVAGAAKRTTGEAWAWGRKNSTTDITLLVAASAALWAAQGASAEVWSAWA